MDDNNTEMDSTSAGSGEAHSSTSANAAQLPNGTNSIEESFDGAECLGLPDNTPEDWWSRIRDEKTACPSMFVSGWDTLGDESEDGVQMKDLTDPQEQFLTAAEDGNLQVMQRMHFQSPDILHARDTDRYTPLHRAAYNNRVDVCQWLLSVGANPELRTESGWTALHCAACWANFEVVALLLSHGVDVNARSNGHLTPLHLAINSTEAPERQYATVAYLLEAPGVDLGAVSGAGDTPLVLAKRTSPRLLELLQQHLARA